MSENRNGVGCEKEENNMDKISLKDEKRRKKLEKNFQVKARTSEKGKHVLTGWEMV
jgi:predicted amidophosphoribosyltransferase